MDDRKRLPANAELDTSGGEPTWEGKERQPEVSRQQAIDLMKVLGKTTDALIQQQVLQEQSRALREQGRALRELRLVTLTLAAMACITLGCVAADLITEQLAFYVLWIYTALTGTWAYIGRKIIPRHRKSSRE